MGCEYVRFEVVLHARFIPNAISVEPQKMTCLYQRMPVQKQLYSFVLLKAGQSDDFRNHLDIAQRTNIVVIRPMRDRGIIADIDIVLNIQHAEPAIARCKMNRPKNVFMAPAGLEAQ